MNRQSIRFNSHGIDCHAWFYRASTSPELAPVVVMAHGLGGTKDSGLEPFAERLADAGMHALAFDYRGFGSSDGFPRQQVSFSHQIGDYHAAVSTAARLPGVDPTRVVLWGVSLAGGHVLAVAGARNDVAAVVAVTPLVDGIAAARSAMGEHSAGALLRSALTGVRSRVGRGQRTIPIVGHPGELAALTSDGYYEAHLGIAGPSWRNEIDATVGTQLASYRPTRYAARIDCPALVQIADFDRAAPPHAAAKAAFKARAEVRHYPCDHFGVYQGQECFDSVVSHQISFLTRHLSVRAASLAEVIHG
ncbi:alpha/beta hydrolase [Mycobacteroides salmoniphilum]|uniref:alpha/beta hydrolase n=1 Tax=Mycobacteroides salmoniphilum TaxID=404941 RepID=UPI0010659F6D|nr:alpha/beta fold hydrolase [Mycobacteroides salmoniphilum]TDZ78824.1 Alpha/beta hydrolase family protein [Mycobacteroides salmoniphilum]TDZ86401.1 Alpha/beta hydrolase family protein [Mycobacteroides salmoniphilum]